MTMSMPDVVRLGGVCILYGATALFGLSLDAVSGVAAAVWLPAGIALVELVLYGLRLWPGIAAAAFLANLWVGAPILVASGIALGHTLEAALGAVLLTRVVRFHPALDRLQDVLRLVVLAAGVSTLIGAIIAVGSGWLGGVIPAAAAIEAGRTWWFGHALGDLLVAPLLFVWSGPVRMVLPRRWIAEAVVLLGVVGALSLVVFGDLTTALPLPTYLIFPALVWVALQLGPPGAVMALAFASAGAMWGTAQELGPFARPTLDESLVSLQAFMSIVTVTILACAAAVAEHRQAEAAVHEQRERLRVTLSSIGDAVLATDSQGRVTLMNPVAASLTGWPEAEALGHDMAAVFQIVNEFTRQAVEPPIGKVIRAGTVVGLANHTLLIARDGVERPIDDSAAPIRDAQGHILGVVLVFRDITARWRAEITREHLAAIVDSSEDAIIGKTLDGTITSWNRSAERLYGYTAAEAIGQPISLLCPFDISDEIPHILERLRRGERLEHYETQRLRKDGSRVDVSLTISPIHDPSGQIIGASKIARDITEPRRAQQAVQQAYAELEQRVEARTAELRAANEALQREIAERQRLEQDAQRAEHFVMLGRLAAGVSHEIRNPLGAAFLHVDLLEEELREPSPESRELIAESLAEVKTNLSRLEELVQNYLSLARVAHLATTPQDLGAAVQAWAKEWQILTTHQGITLQLAGVQDCGAVAFHASTLRRVLLNLVQNALDAMPQGGTLTVTGQGTTTHAQLQIQDTGSGIAPEQLPKIFEPLYTTKPEGTGLGLFIAHEIVAAHGGTITVESVEGQGTTFTLTLPRTVSEARPMS
jgi:PAS domain S-box-containing protein